MSESKHTTEHEERIIAALDFAADVTNKTFGLGWDDKQWLREQIEQGSSEDKLGTAVEIAVALLHRLLDEKRENAKQRSYP